MKINWKDKYDRRLYYRNYYKLRRLKQLQLCAEINNNSVKCFKCGHTDVNNLELDHMNKNDKSFNIKQRMLDINELRKCQILCFICHDIKTSIENTNEVHGTPRKSKRCKCSICLAVRIHYNRKYKLSSKLNK